MVKVKFSGSLSLHPGETGQGVMVLDPHQQVSSLTALEAGEETRVGESLKSLVLPECLSGKLGSWAETQDQTGQGDGRETAAMHWGIPMT